MSPVEILGALRRLPLAPRSILLGTFIGFAAFCLLGRQAARTDEHKNFVRLTRYTSPETLYYPTVNELMSIVRARTKPGQILVIVGGNSVLRGVGQPADKIWTKRLQAELGAGYAVFNFAFNGSSITDGAAVVAEALRNEFPKQIYMANTAPTHGVNPEGSLVYRFLFWDAWSKGYLDKTDAKRNTKISDTHANRAYHFQDGFAELTIRDWFDRWFYFQDFWNDVSLTRFSTVWGAYMPGPLLFSQARNSFKDPEPDFLNPVAIPFAARYRPDTIAIELLNVRGCSWDAFEREKTPDGKWKIYEPAWQNFHEEVAASFPQALKKRTLVLMSHSSPYYVNKLTPDEIERDGLAYTLAVKEWEKAGYASMEYGKDFHATQDYGDRTHLTWKGGEKLAVLVAAKVRDMSKELGYLDPK